MDPPCDRRPLLRWGDGPARFFVATPLEPWPLAPASVPDRCRRRCQIDARIDATVVRKPSSGRGPDGALGIDAPGALVTRLEAQMDATIVKSGHFGDLGDRVAW